MNNDYNSIGFKKYYYLFKGEKYRYIGLKETLLRDYPGAKIYKTIEIKIK